MSTPQKPSSDNSDLLIPVFTGALCGWPTYALFAHYLAPDSFPHAALGWLAHLGGFVGTVTQRAGIAAGLAAVIGIIVGALLHGKMQESRLTSAAMKDARANLRVTKAMRKLSGETTEEEDDKAIRRAYARPEDQERNNATLGFVLTLVAAGIVILFVAEIVLNHSR